ncbi:MAG TPA: hypothetical protein VNF99_05270 [Stellaceae bacterium]|nr:hypothetical protein [Stellaceae bacterium]
MAIQKATWSKSKSRSEARLPALTTDAGKTTNTNWHRITIAEGAEQAAPWTVIWDTSRRAGVFNTAQDATQSAALDRAKQMLRMNFIVYKISEPSGSVFLDEAEIKERLGPKPATVR